MRLKSLTYSQFKGDSREWEYNDLVLRDINLIVGKNAVGKSKVLHTLHGLSLILSSGNKLKYTDGAYDVLFENDGEEIRYSLKYRDTKIYHEEFQRGNEILLTRGDGGKGIIYAEKEGKNIEFQTPQDEIAVVARRDSLQHSYLEPLYQWASKVLFYHFGSLLGKENLWLFGPNFPPLDLRNEHMVVSTYIHGFDKFKDQFDLKIREDMKAVGYELENVGAHPLESFQAPGGTLIGLVVKEKDLPGSTEHTDISTGMFRALSLFVQLNYAILSDYPSCVLVDDIGEGLDYERSCSLIQRLIGKATQAGVQLIMSTNDRFVMNNVPLEAWTVLQRSGGHIKVFNYDNSKKIFDDFKFSGLNNFDFFAYDYLGEDVVQEETYVEAGNLR